MTLDSSSDFRNEAAAGMYFSADGEEISLRRNLTAVRDALLVIAFQAVFQATQAMRSFNY